MNLTDEQKAGIAKFMDFGAPGYRDSARSYDAHIFWNGDTDGDRMLSLLNRAAELSPKGGPQLVGVLLNAMAVESAMARVERRVPRFPEVVTLAVLALPEAQA